MLNAVRLHVMIKNIRVEAYAAFPGDGRGFRIDAHLLELAHVAPQLERADLEQVAEKHAAFETVLEAQPQLVIVFCLARRYPHGVEFLKHVIPPVNPSSTPRRSDTRSRGSRR